VAVINETFSRKYFAQEDVRGRQLDLGGAGTGMIKPYTIVGIIGDQLDTSASQPPQPLLMLPNQQVPADSLYYPPLLKNQVHLLVKTRGNIAPASFARSIFRRLAPDLAIDNFQTMQQSIDQSNFSSRLRFYLIAAFAGLAVLMVIAGLDGVLSQVVSQRRREFGLRMALGATRQSIVRNVLLQGSGIVAIGLAIGILLASLLGHIIQGFLYGVKPMDATTYAVAVIVLFLVGAGAALVPAWRAASFEPVTALRDE
jgi:predicted lysophospholipase L1 biosynthesis ABC-type transport system permease subunit